MESSGPAREGTRPLTYTASLLGYKSCAALMGPVGRRQRWGCPASLGTSKSRRAGAANTRREAALVHRAMQGVVGWLASAGGVNCEVEEEEEAKAPPEARGEGEGRQRRRWN
ncbi:hypothetical protein PR202_ga24414 [Eleusine coracana subsp. coracana]|uniref:Uncharacterized protein n=1 Tax=Eleusine coracana subsp. coracana TaxID=191504 RepID=A0AAV5D8T2_ELECO|nr:hypothetical protein PR202_ga24414 [Eleusine coracana subsp. coracana]